MKQIDNLVAKLRGEFSTRMDDSDIVEILEVLQVANEKVERLEKEKLEAYQSGYKQGKFDELMDDL